jgi:hypothetical protein
VKYTIGLIFGDCSHRLTNEITALAATDPTIRIIVRAAPYETEKEFQRRVDSLITMVAIMEELALARGRLSP